jgi:hypothetical protein
MPREFIGPGGMVFEPYKPDPASENDMPDDPPPAAGDDYAGLNGDAEPEHVANGAGPNGQARKNGSAKAKPFPSLSVSEINARPLKDPLRLVSGLIGERSIALVWGPSTVGKSFLLVSLCFAIALGIPWFGYKCLRGGVLYIALEGEEGFFNRIKAYTLKFLQERGVPFRVIFSPINFGPNEQDKMGPAMNENVQRLIATIEEMNKQYDVPVRAVVYDNFRTATPGLRGNYDEEVAGFYAKARHIAQETDSASFVVHNSGKDASRGARGSQFHEDVADVELEAKESGGARSFNVVKVRDGQSGAVHGFKLEPVSLGTVKDIDGVDKEIGSCVVYPAEAPDETKTRPATKAEQAVEALYAALADAPITPPDHRRYPTNIITFTTVKAFEAELEARGIVTANEPEEVKDEADRARKMAGNIRKQNSRVRDMLRNRQLLAEFKGICWCPKMEKGQ